MKKLMLLCCATALLATAAHAQSERRSPLRFGLKAGANISHLRVTNNGYTTESNSFAPGVYGGGLLEISGPAGSKFKGQIEALFNWHNFKNKYTEADLSLERKISLSQISVPIMVKYFVIPSLSINAGGSVNFNIAGKIKDETDVRGLITRTETDMNDADMLQTLQVGALVGATYYIYKGFFVDARYNYYFGSMAKNPISTGNDDPAYRISAIQVGIGYKF